MRKKQLVQLLVLAGITIAICIATIDKTECEGMVIEEKKLSVEEMAERDIQRKFDAWVEAEKSEYAPFDFLKLDDEYQIYMEERCAELGLDFFLAASLMFSESSFRADAVGDNGKSIGFFQINECNWETMSDKYGLDVFVPLDNIECGLIIFSKLMDKYGDATTAIQCYKCGESRGKKLLKEGKVLGSIEGIIERADEWRVKANEE